MIRMVDREIEILTKLKKKAGQSNQAWRASILECYRARLGDPAIQDAVDLVLKATDNASKPTVGDCAVGEATNTKRETGNSNDLEGLAMPRFKKSESALSIEKNRK